MKKFIYLLLLLFCIPYSLSAINGNGTYGSPYNGSLTTDMTWNGTVYVNGDVTVNGFTLTIDPGAVIVFLNTGADLIITGTGVLQAVGTGSSTIRFTADSDNSATYGGPGETRGHISFQSMGTAATSNIEFCIFEYGRISGTYSDGDIWPVYWGLGGAIYIDFSNLIISNCTFRYNYAEFGGAIYIYGTSPSISNCIFINNDAFEGGGALFIYTGSGALIENCLFDGNHASGTSYDFYSGGAIFFGTGDGTASVVNCTFVNNISDRIGDAIFFYEYFNYQIKNCILWGSDVQLNIGGSNIINCAIQGFIPNGCVNTIALNSSNTGTSPAGPNFTDPNNSDWSLRFISPCRDSGTSSGAPSTDILGNSRIGIYDIGAYEVQYSRWLTTPADYTSWTNAGNWEQGLYPNLAGTTGDVIIPSLISDANAPNISGTTTIASGKSMILEPGAKATFNTLTNNGDLKLMSDISGTSSLITNNSVSAILELYLTGGGSSSTYKWHYISSPVSALPVNTFILKPTMDFAQYFEARPTTNPMQGWIAYDGYIYYTGGYLTGSPYVISGTNLNVGQGYNYFYSSDYKFTFSGNINVSSVSPTITYGGDATNHGFNLLGNPFPSGLDWTTITDDPGYPTLTSKGLYFTRDNTQCSYISGVGYPDASVTGIIPPMQGFFIRTTNTSTTLPLLAGARAHNIPARYKGEGETIPLVRLQLDNDSIKDNTVVRFDTKASATFDNDFDAVRMFLSESIQYIYSTDGISKYAINGQPFPETTLQIPLSVNILLSGNHTITATQLQGLETYNIGLKDNTTGFTADLKSNPAVLFSSNAGTFTDRFVLIVSGSTTAIPEYPGISDKSFNIYHYQDMLNIQTFDNEWDGKTGSVSIFSLTGKMVESEQNVEFYKNSLIQIPAPETKGLYVVEIKSGVNRYVGKVVIK